MRIEDHNRAHDRGHEHILVHDRGHILRKADYYDRRQDHRFSRPLEGV